MFILGNLVSAAASVIDIVLELYKWAVIIAAIISWVNPDPYNPIVRFLHRVTEPVFRPIRRAIGGRLGPVDISPIIVIFVIIFLQNFIVTSLKQIGMRMH